MNSIKIKLSLIANLIAIFALIVLGIVSFYFTKTSLYESTLKNQTDLLKVTQSTVEDFRSTNQSFTRALEKDIANLPYQSLITEENIINNVGPILKYYRHSINALNVYLGLNNGKVLLSQKSNDAKMPELRDDLDIKTKDWYQEALKTNDIFVTPAYLDTILKQYVITYSKAIYKDGKIIGVLGVDIPSEDLQNLVANTPGNTFLFDQKNKIFAATNKELLNPSIDHSPVLNAYKLNGDNNFFSYKLNNEERLGACTKVFAYTACITESADIINKPIFKAAYIQVIALIVMISISVILLYFIVSKYLSPLAAIQTGLTSFFDFINYKTKNVSTIEVKSNDEFGQISNAINENILATKRGLEQDNQAVKESVQTVSVVEGGNLTARITANPRNPQLIELKNVLNKLLDVLQARVGSDMNAIHKIFEEYKSLDFRNKLENASGSVELTTNALGDEIVKMLKQSSDFANALANESGKLQTAVQSLTTSSYDNNLAFDTQKRTKDYTPTTNLNKQGGGSKEFRNFLITQLIPYINKMYPIDFSHQILFGHSFGGLFAIDTLLYDSKIFSHYFIISPSLWWDNSEFLPNIIKLQTCPKIYIGLGSLETNSSIIKGVAKLNAQKLSEKISKETNCKTHFKLFKNETHGSVISKAMLWMKKLLDLN